VSASVTLYVVHHADAVSPDVDPQRPLSASGVAHVQRLAREAAEKGVKPDAIWHSGKLRARQTAEAFWRACNPLAPFEAVRGLQPEDPPVIMKDRVWGDTRTIMLVGHQPHLSRLLALLTRQEESETWFPAHGILALETEGESGVWREAWRLT